MFHAIAAELLEWTSGVPAVGEQPFGGMRDVAVEQRVLQRILFEHREHVRPELRIGAAFALHECSSRGLLEIACTVEHVLHSLPTRRVHVPCCVWRVMPLSQRAL